MQRPSDEQPREQNNPRPEEPPPQQRWYEAIWGELHLNFRQMRLKVTGIATTLLVGVGSYTVYRVVTENPKLFFKFATVLAEGSGRIMSMAGDSSILVDIIVENRREAEKLIKSLESGELLKTLNKEFDVTRGPKIQFDSIDLVEVKLLKQTKDFKTLKKEAENALNLFVKRNKDTHPVGSEVIFCNVEVEKVFSVSHERTIEPTTSTSTDITKQHFGTSSVFAKDPSIVMTSDTEKQVTLRGVPPSFSVGEAKRLLQEILNDDSSVIGVRYPSSSDGSVMVVELRSPQLVENLLTNTSAQTQIKEAFRKKMAAMEKRKDVFYEAKICGVPEGFDLIEAQKLLQEIVDDNSVVTDVNYLENPDGSVKKSTIVALMATPKQPLLKTDPSDNELWFVKERFQKPKLQKYDRHRQTCQKQMLLVKQSKEMKRNLEDNLYVIDMIKA